MSDSDFDERDVSVEDDDSIPPEEDAADEEEVSSLMKESQMSLDELLATYGISSSASGHNNDTTTSVARGKSGRLKSIRRTVPPSSIASLQEISLPPAKKLRRAVHTSVSLDNGNNDMSNGENVPASSSSTDLSTIHRSSDVDALVDKNKADTSSLGCLTVLPHAHSVPCSHSASPISIDVSCSDPSSAAATPPKHSKRTNSDDSIISSISSSSHKNSSRGHLLRSRSKSNLTTTVPTTSELLLLDSTISNEENPLEREDTEDTSVSNFDMDVENELQKNELQTIEDKSEMNDDYSSRFWKSAITGQETPPSYNSDEDEDYCPSEDSGRDWKGEIKVGEEYQANVPMLIVASSNTEENQTEENSSSSSYYGAERIFRESSLVWKPSEKLCEADVTRFERSYAQVVLSTLPMERTIDDEEALFLLMRCDYDVDEALQRLQLKAVSPAAVPGYLDSWSESDCTAFEKSFALYGKDFRQIRETRLRHKTISELIHFYYLWKKTARHDEFARIYRRDKKKSSHPNIADFMDCLAMEQEILAESYVQNVSDITPSTTATTTTATTNTSNTDNQSSYYAQKSVQHNNHNNNHNNSSIKSGDCRQIGSSSMDCCNNNGQNIRVVSTNGNEIGILKNVINRSTTGLTDDGINDHEITTTTTSSSSSTAVCASDGSGNRCKLKSNGGNVLNNTPNNNNNETNNYHGTYCIKQSDHMPSSSSSTPSSSTRSTRTTPSTTTTTTSTTVTV
ncbi:unnamed protein product [Schistosoma turkestanicum]|nr:unnamed protein product [Schistosoma turkestanicum]